jgi:uncharacterized membrane protein YdfJ with MMPL/SSD domain
VLFLLPILVYLFVVAIGTDYNILMIARLPEEAAAGNEPRPAADLAVEHAGPSVVSAGHVSEPDQLGRVEPTGNGSARSRSTRL